MLGRVDAEDHHALRIAPGDADRTDGGADHLALVGGEHDLLARLDREARHHAPIARPGVDVGDALAAAIGAAIFIGAGALAKAVLGNGEDELLAFGHFGDPIVGQGALGALALAPGRAAQISLALFRRGACATQDGHGDDFVAAQQPHSAYAGRAARLELAHVGRHEADGLAVAGGEEDVVLAHAERHPDQAVAGILFLAFLGDPELHRDLAGGRDVLERVHAVAADGSVRGREHQVQRAPAVLILGQGQDGRDDLACLQRQQVDHRPPLGRRPALGQPPDLHSIDPAKVGEEQDGIVGRGHEQVGDRILVLGGDARTALAAALLLAEDAQRRALDVTGHGHGHDHVLALDQVFVVDPVGGGGQFGPARGRELAVDHVQFVAHEFI